MLVLLWRACVKWGWQRSSALPGSLGSVPAWPALSKAHAFASFMWGGGPREDANQACGRVIHAWGTGAKIHEDTVKGNIWDAHRGPKEASEGGLGAGLTGHARLMW